MSDEPSVLATLGAIMHITWDASSSVLKGVGWCLARVWAVVFHSMPWVACSALPVWGYGAGVPPGVSVYFVITALSAPFFLTAWLWLNKGAAEVAPCLDDLLTSKLRDAIKSRAVKIDTQRTQAKASNGALSLTDPDPRHDE